MARPNLDLISDASGPNSFCRPISNIHKFYLSGELKSPDEYVAWFEEIRTAPEGDIIYLHINCPGGDAFSAIQFLRALYETKATTIASVEGACMSAATMLFMAAQHHEITSHSVFMFHDFSTMAVGKGGEVFDQVIHQKGWGEGLLRDIYKHFLTEKDIALILTGKDVYMRPEEVADRLRIRDKKTKRVIKVAPVTPEKTVKVKKISKLK